MGGPNYQGRPALAVQRLEEMASLSKRPEHLGIAYNSSSSSPQVSSEQCRQLADVILWSVLFVESRHLVLWDTAGTLKASIRALAECMARSPLLLNCDRHGTIVFRELAMEGGELAMGGEDGEGDEGGTLRTTLDVSRKTRASLQVFKCTHGRHDEGSGCPCKQQSKNKRMCIVTVLSHEQGKQAYVSGTLSLGNASSNGEKEKKKQKKKKKRGSEKKEGQEEKKDAGAPVLLHEELRRHTPPPQLLLVLGERHGTLDFPSWLMSIAEIVNWSGVDEIDLAGFCSAMEFFSKTTQRKGT
jgi:hypothetical protein